MWGTGAGTADPAHWPNVLRVFVGESTATAIGSVDTIVELQTNIDDLNPQIYETVFDRIFAAGALDATLAPVTMKKGRPGNLLSVLVPREKVEAVLAVMFADTTALGIRIQEVQRRILPRRFTSVRVNGQDVRIKLADYAPGISKASPEYEDCRRIAEQSGRPVKDILEAAMLMYRQSQEKRRRVKVSK